MSSFKEVEEIVKDLQSEKLIEHAKNVDDALKGGSTGSEIWGGVRFYLLKIPKDSISALTKNKIEALITSIDKVLPR